MSGHSKWSQIKHKKAITDSKKSKVFSKIIGAIAVAARSDNDPSRNPRLRTLIEKARGEGVSNETIERALKRSTETDALQEMIIEAYGPGTIALIIEAITSNTNRTIQDLRMVLGEHGGKIATPGSVLWLFTREGMNWKAKFEKSISESDHRALTALLALLEEHPDIQRVSTDRAPLL